MSQHEFFVSSFREKSLLSKRGVTAATLTLSAICLLPPCAAAQAGTYTNPLLGSVGASDTDSFKMADPNVLAPAHGEQYYYVYATGSRNDGTSNGIRMTRTKDFSPGSFSDVSNALLLPSWVDETNPGYSAPTVVWDPNPPGGGTRYVMYYNARKANTNDNSVCIGVATAATPDGPFTDVGQPLTGCYPIYPVFVDAAPFQRADGTWWMSYGSYDVGKQSVPVFQLQISDITKLVSKTPGTPDGYVFPTHQNCCHNGEREGTFTFRPGNGYEYMLSSGDKWNGGQDSYAVAVGRRSETASALSNFSDFTGQRTHVDPGTILGSPTDEGSSFTWNNPGSSGAFQDGTGNWWLVYGTEILGDKNNTRYLFIDPITFGPGGWPQVASQATNPEQNTPTFTSQVGPVKYPSE